VQLLTAHGQRPIEEQKLRAADDRSICERSFEG
jgi:hypothetical protein